MSTKPKPQTTEVRPQRDIETFRQLPEDTKDLMKLKDQDEKTSGPKQVEIKKEIDEKADEKE